MIQKMRNELASTKTTREITSSGDIRGNIDLANKNAQSLKPNAEPLASQSSPKAKMAPNVLGNCAVRMRLENIGLEHHLARDLEREMGLPFFAAPPREHVPAAWVVALLERMPLVVREDHGEGVTCVGNIRLYRLAQIALSGDEMIPVRRDTGSLTARRKQQLREGLLAEAFLLPAVFEWSQKLNHLLRLTSVQPTFWPKVTNSLYLHVFNLPVIHQDIKSPFSSMQLRGSSAQILNDRTKTGFWARGEDIR